MEVSARLRADPEVEGNLSGYLIAAFHRRVRAQLLETVGWPTKVSFSNSRKTTGRERRVDRGDGNEAGSLTFLVSHLPHQTKHMLTSAL